MITYFLQAGVILTAGAILYRYFLYKETFYQLNRFVLLISIIAAFTLPLIPLPETLSLKNLVSRPFNTWVNGSSELMIIYQWLSAIYWGGVIIFLLNTFIQFGTLIYQRLKYPVIRDKEYSIVELTGNKAPFSFGKTIFINPALYDWETYEMILLHEKEHIRQRHSFDLVLAECMLALQWWNPFAWKLYRSVAVNIEFLTDDTVLQKHKVNKSDYQFNLLQVAAPNSTLQMANAYNQSVLKKRMIMMNRQRSNTHVFWKYFIYIPIWFLLMAFMNEVIPQVKPILISKPSSDVNISKTEGSKPIITQNDSIPQKQLPLIQKQLSVNRQTAKPVEAEIESPLTEEPPVSKEIKEVKPDTSHTPVQETKPIEKKTITEFPVNQRLSITDLDRLKKAGVTLPVIQSYSAIGLSDLSADEILLLRKNDISAPVIKSYWDINYYDRSLKTILFFRKNNITAPVIDSYIKTGYQFLSPENIVELRKGKIIAPVLQDYMQAGYANLAPSVYIELKKENITPVYIRSFQQLGFKDISVETLKKLKKQKITSVNIQTLMQNGYVHDNLEAYIPKNK
ncbi:M56 family metallopeptidase [Gynurincola endophyticus]|uniref:M56 family metallopeptidase n=1 Tax=Gynurincola endophyticus TaxID=2479004 RepID=UPI000F8E20EB|nr:M56 family metallopeptidase [Gynurincola endophyticus]